VARATGDGVQINGGLVPENMETYGPRRIISGLGYVVRITPIDKP